MVHGSMVRGSMVRGSIWFHGQRFHVEPCRAHLNPIYQKLRAAVSGYGIALGQRCESGFVVSHHAWKILCVSLGLWHVMAEYTPHQLCYPRRPVAKEITINHLCAHAHTARKKGGDGNEEKHGGEDIWGGHMWTRQDDEDGDRHDTDGFGLLRKVDSYVGHSLPLAVYSSRIPTGDQTRRTSSDNLCAFLLGSVPKSNEKASLTLGNAIEELHVLPNKPR